MADCMPPEVPYDMLDERILGSDHSSAFAVGREQRGYQLLGINYYSTTRTKIPFLEIVKRTVHMVRELAANLGLDLAGSNSAIHYPNIFPETWATVTRYLRSPKIEHVLDGMFDRAQCVATDSVISLAKLHRSEGGVFTLSSTMELGFTLGFACSRRPTQTNQRPEGRQVGGIHGLSSTSGVHDVRGGARSPAPCGLDLLRTIALFACHHERGC
jgi:hypothetical protein